MLNIPEFKFPNIQIPNPTEWATNAAEIFTKSISDKLMQLFMDACKTVLEIIDDVSFEACLLMGIVAIILSVFGYDKGKKIATLSPVVYIIIQIFLEVWFGI